MQLLAFAFTPRHHASSAVQTVPQGSQQPALLLCSTQCAQVMNQATMGYEPGLQVFCFLGEKVQNWEMTSKAYPFSSLSHCSFMILSFCDCHVLFMSTWKPLPTKKDNIVEAEMQLIMWCYKEAGRGWGELLHQARQLLRSEMQGRKDKSFEEMEENRKKCEFCSTGSVKAPRCTPAVYLTLSVK